MHQHKTYGTCCVIDYAKDCHKHGKKEHHKKKDKFEDDDDFF